MSALEYGVLFFAGLMAAVLNVFAAGGSFMTLPLLIFLGLPATVANGTNRVGVLAQNISASFEFHRHQKLPLAWAAKAGAAAMVGAAFGVWGALAIPDIAFRRVLSMVMLAMALMTFLHRSSRVAPRATLLPPTHWSMIVAFLFVGLYGGFLQAGVGFLALATTTWAGFDLIQGNAIKVFTVMLLTVLSLAIFAGTGHVHWPAGIALGLGNLLGGIIGVRIAVVKGHAWLNHIVNIALAVFAVLLWVSE